MFWCSSFNHSENVRKKKKKNHLMALKWANWMLTACYSWKWNTKNMNLYYDCMKLLQIVSINILFRKKKKNTDVRKRYFQIYRVYFRWTCKFLAYKSAPLVFYSFVGVRQLLALFSSIRFFFFFRFGPLLWNVRVKPFALFWTQK